MKFRNRKTTDFLYIHMRDTGGLTMKELHRDAMRSGKLTVDYHYVLQESGIVEEGRDRYAVAGNQLDDAERSLYVLIDTGKDGLMTDAQRLSLSELMDVLNGVFTGMKTIVNE